jgi:BirA family transcriptional regulator, biotin operon repressor / biotin---[acetyl-CoA-carboxylase] ligase
MFDGKTLSWIHLPSVDSTNRWVEDRAQSFPPQALTIVYADEQTAGYGQHGRPWISPPHCNLYASFFFRLEKAFPFLANIGQTLTASCIKALQDFHLQPEVKWPNDLRFKGKKFGGILACTTTIDEESAIVLGVGINVNMSEDLLQSIDQAATSLLVESGLEWKIEEVLFRIVESFLADLDELCTKGFSSIAKRLQSVLCFVGQPVLFTDGSHSLQATCRGIDELGRLQLQLPSGTINTVYTGSIRPLNEGLR